MPISDPLIQCQQMKSNQMQCINPAFEFFLDEATGVYQPYCRLHYSFLVSQKSDADALAAEIVKLDDEKQQLENSEKQTENM